MNREAALQPSRTAWLVIVATGLAVFMAQLDTTAVVVALPTIERGMGVDTSLTQWVVLGYVLPMVALSLPSGRWLDGIGHRAALVFAVSGFGLASVAVGISPGFEWLIGARIVQGAFAAILFALIPVVTTVAATPERRGRAMGVVMALGPLGGVAGPVVGGLLVEHASWQWIFYLNVPICLLVIGIGLARMSAGPPLRFPGRGFASEVGLLGVAGVALMVALTFTAERGPVWLLLALTAIPALALWRRQPASEPVRDLLRTPGMIGPHAALLTQMAAVMAVVFLIPFHLHRTAELTPAEVGMTMLAFPLAVMVFGLMGGALADRGTPRRVAAAGAVVITAGIALIIPLGADWTVGDLWWRLALVGAGAGLFAGPNQTLAMAGSPRHLLGTTGASTSLSRQLGMALGPALATTVWTLSDYAPGGMRAAIALAAALTALSVLALIRTTTVPASARVPDREP